MQMLAMQQRQMQQMLEVIMQQQQQQQQQQQHVRAPQVAPTQSTTEVLPLPMQQQQQQQLQTKFKKIQRGFVDNMHKVERTETKIANVQKQVQVLSEDGWRFPAGVRPFSSQDTFSEMDNAAHASLENDYVLQVVFKRGTTKREWARMMYHHCQRLTKELELEALQEHLAKLKARSTKAVFIAECEEAAREAQAPLGASELGLEEPAQRALSTRMLRQQCEASYEGAVAAILETKERRRKAQEVQTQDHAQKEKELLTAKPHELFQRAVQAAVKRELDKTSEEMLDDNDEAPTEQAFEELLRSWPKQGGGEKKKQKKQQQQQQQQQQEQKRGQPKPKAQPTRAQPKQGQPTRAQPQPKNAQPPWRSNLVSQGGGKRSSHKGGRPEPKGKGKGKDKGKASHPADVYTEQMQNVGRKGKGKSKGKATQTKGGYKGPSSGRN